MLKYKKTGFTLLEILIVIALIGVLTMAGLTSYIATQRTARDGRRSADLKMVQNALESYFADNVQYPAVSSGVACDPGTQYLPMGLPKDPKTNVVYTSTASPPCSTSAYCYCAAMENSSAANSDSACNFTAASKTNFCVKNLQ